MRQDEQTYRRAASAAVIGIVVQVLLTIAMLVTALWTRKGLEGESWTFMAMTVHFAAGLPIWIILWMVYYQHRLERLESFESERLSQTDEQAAALFDEHGSQLFINRLQKYTLVDISGISDHYESNVFHIFLRNLLHIHGCYSSKTI